MAAVSEIPALDDGDKEDKYKYDLVDEAELLESLEKEGKQFDKSAEIDRIIKAQGFNGYDILNLTSGVAEEDIKRAYRKTSLLIHPDKTTDKRAPEAFDKLKKAQTQLLDEKARERLDEAMTDARMLAMRELKLDKDDERVKDPDPEFKELWKSMIFKVLSDDEERRKRKLKAQMQEEGRQQRKDQEEIEERKRKRKYEQDWEATRDGRIGSWRDFQKGAGAGPVAKGGGIVKKKVKAKTLG